MTDAEIQAAIDRTEAIREPGLFTFQQLVERWFAAGAVVPALGRELLEARALLRRWLGQTDGSGQAAREMELQEYIERVRGLREDSEALLGEEP